MSEFQDYLTTPRHQLKKVRKQNLQVPISAIYHDRDMYANFPAFQRDFVWTRKFKSEFIQSILQGMFIPAIQMVPVPPGTNGAWNVIDGQQRLRTVIDQMSVLSGDVPKPFKGSRDHFFYEMTYEEASIFRQYPLEFVVIEDYTIELLGENYRRLQNQLPLTTGEKLWSYDTVATQAAKLACRSLYFGDIFVSRTKIPQAIHRRKSAFQAAIFCVGVELSYPFGDLSAHRLYKVASYNEDVTDLASIVSHKVDCMYNLFMGTNVYSMTEVLAQYLITWILDFIGFDIKNSEVGCLSNYYMSIKPIEKRLRTLGHTSTFSAMANKKFQKEFFREHLGQLVMSSEYSKGLKYRLTPEDVHSNYLAFKGWIQHDGICPFCNAQHVSARQIQFHSFKPGQAHCTNVPFKFVVESQEV